MTDHSAEIERLAQAHCVSPLILLEWWLERSAIRQYEAGLSRADAERLAIEDVERELEGRNV